MYANTSYGDFSNFFQNSFWFFFITSFHPERCASSYALASKNDSGSHFIFSKRILIFLFITSLFLFFFIKIIITSLRGRNQLRVRSPLFPVRIFFTRWDLFWCDSGSPLPVSPRRSGAKLGRFAWGNPLLLRTCLLQKWVALATNKSAWHYFFSK